MIALKRAYDPVSRTDGRRFLVERLWPRGVSKAELRVEAWLRDVGPSTGLRQWFGHDPEKWEEFRRRYWAELNDRGDLIRDLEQRLKRGPVTFVFAAKDEGHNSAVALKEYLEGAD